MAAGLGFKTFTTGEVLTAADTNGYLMQGVLVFASSAARAAAITSPQEGQYSYLKDTNSTEYYDGAAWIAAPIGDITGVTAGTGISGGGTSGTVTITNSMATEIAAKGDLIVGTGAATFDNLTVGANGTTLVADSTASTGLKWATASSGSTFRTQYVSVATDVTLSSASLVDITGYTLTFTPTSATNKIIVSFDLAPTANAQTRIVIQVDGVTGWLGEFQTNNAVTTLKGGYQITNLSATSHTIKLQQFTAGGASITYYGSNSGYVGHNLMALELY